MKVNHTITTAERRKLRVRSKVTGSAERPRLHVLRSNKYMYLQVIDDAQGKTLVSASTKTDKKAGTKTESTIKAAQELAKQLLAKKINKLVFDRGSYRYHGRVKAVAEAMREQGIQV